MVQYPATLRIDLTKSTADILRAADKAEPKLRRALLAAFKDLQAALPDLEDLLATGNVTAVTSAIANLRLPMETYAALTNAAIETAWAAGAPTAATFGISFNSVNTRALTFASMEAARMIDVGLALQSVIRDSIIEGLDRGLHPSVMARNIRDIVPLTSRHAASVERLYWRSLDDGVTLAHAEKIRSRKAAKLLRWRTETIARTESLKAANMGQQMVWESARDLDLVPKGTKKVWRTNIDERTCPICLPMNGETVAIEGDFRLTEGVKTAQVQKTPPAHPNCRCTLTLEFIPVPA